MHSFLSKSGATQPGPTLGQTWANIGLNSGHDWAKQPGTGLRVGLNLGHDWAKQQGLGYDWAKLGLLGTRLG